MIKAGRVTLSIVLVGLGSAAVIYLTAQEPQDNPFADYEQSKRFSHDVQRMGGKISLVANDLSSWFSGLWQGQQLAWSVAFITMVIAAVYYLVASGTHADKETAE
jgi:hypothetical protein